MSAQLRWQADSPMRHGAALGVRPGAALRRAALLLTAALLLLTAPAAQAHGGFQIMAETQGPYSVVVRAKPFEYKGVDQVDVTAYVVRQDLGEPDLGATLTLTLDGEGGRRTLHPEVVGDGYQSIFNAPKTAWRTWTVQATVVGKAGTATVRGGPVGEDPGFPLWLIGVTAVLLAGLGLLVRQLTRDDDEPAADPDDWTAPGRAA